MISKKNNYISIYLSKGWNLIGASYDCTLNDKDNITKSNTLFDAQYNNVTKLNKYKGYWIFCNEPGDILLDIISQEGNNEIQLDKGWNLIGTTFNCNYEDNEIIIKNSLYEFNDKYYERSNLGINKGYWIKAKEAGTIKLTDVCKSTSSCDCNFINLQSEQKKEEEFINISTTSLLSSYINDEKDFTYNDFLNMFSDFLYDHFDNYTSFKLNLQSLEIELKFDELNSKKLFKKVLIYILEKDYGLVNKDLNTIFIKHNEIIDFCNYSSKYILKFFNQSNQDISEVSLSKKHFTIDEYLISIKDYMCGLSDRNKFDKYGIKILKNDAIDESIPEDEKIKFDIYTSLVNFKDINLKVVYNTLRSFLGIQEDYDTFFTKLIDDIGIENVDCDRLSRKIKQQLVYSLDTIVDTNSDELIKNLSFTHVNTLGIYRLVMLPIKMMIEYNRRLNQEKFNQMVEKVSKRNSVSLKSQRITSLFKTNQGNEMTVTQFHYDCFYLDLREDFFNLPSVDKSLYEKKINTLETNTILDEILEQTCSKILELPQNSPTVINSVKLMENIYSDICSSINSDDNFLKDAIKYQFNTLDGLAFGGLLASFTHFFFEYPDSVGKSLFESVVKIHKNYFQ